MAEVELELKDEELLDFDGSEYDFASDEEVDADNGRDLPPPEEEMQEEIQEVQQQQQQNQQLQHQNQQLQQKGRKEGGAESGEIQDDEKGGGLEEVDRDRGRSRSARAQHEPSSGRTRKHGTKAELEDGELIDMVNNKKQQGEHGAAAVKDSRRSALSRKHSSSDALRNERDSGRNADSRHDRKRRRDPYEQHDRHHYNSRDRKEPYDSGRLRHERSYGSPSGRHHDFPDPRSRGGTRSHNQNFGPNFAPGIIGPGRPLRPELRPFVHPNLEASLGRFSPAQLQELLVQEHMLRSQQMLHLARLGVRPPRPIPSMYPPPVGPFIPRHAPPMWGSDPTPQVNGLRPFGRGPRSVGPGALGGDGMLPLPSGRDASRRGPQRAHERGAAAEGSRHLPKQGSAEKATPTDGNATDNRNDKEMDATSSLKANEAGYNGTSIIQLGGPVPKSRVLTISGLQEDTPLSTVAEAFEKQGRVKDFQKSETGDAFTVTYESVHEALSAKRHLHRSILCGRQITVEFA